MPDTARVGCDIDGTLLDYNHQDGQSKANTLAMHYLRGETIALITNQGGLVFGLRYLRRTDGRIYPHPWDFVQRLNFLMGALREYDIKVASLLVSVYHPRATENEIEATASALRYQLRQAGYPTDWWTVYASKRSRKPGTTMLKSAGVHSYWGDSDEDRAAAFALGMPFVPVARFY